MRCAPIPYSNEEMAWLEANHVMVIGDYADAFNAKFGRAVEARHLHGLRKRKGWKVGRELANEKARGKSLIYSAAEMEWLEANCHLSRVECAAQFTAKFQRDIAVGKIVGLRKRKGWLTGRTGCFEKGAVSHNKGKKCPPGVGGRHPNAQRTQFKKGERRARAEQLYKPIGFERVSDGYLVRKVNDGLPMQARWRAVHLIRWEEINGPLPDGMCLKCVDGDKLNTDPGNWELIPRAVLTHLNSRWNDVKYAEAAPELKPAIMAVAKLKHAVKTKKVRA